MFGYAIANQEKLSKEEYEKYRAVYCGLCKKLGENGRTRDKLTLTYDLVLLILVLSSVTDTPFESGEARCVPHPFKRHVFLFNEYTSYAADMSVVLAYYKFLDDKNDNGGAANALKTSLFKSEAVKISEKYPEVCEKISSSLSELSEAEKRNELNPDIPSKIFGELLGAIFAGGCTGHEESLFRFGESLGKAIYLMDASVDIKADLKKERYNPLIRTDFASCEKLLEVILGECMENFNALEVKNDRGIIENVLLSGIWTSYYAQKREVEKRNDK